MNPNPYHKALQLLDAAKDRTIAISLKAWKETNRRFRKETQRIVRKAKEALDE